MAKLTLPSILSGFLSQSQINSAFRSVEAILQDKVLFRDNPAGEPNVMKSDLDMNSKRVLNLPSPINDNEAARFIDIKNGVTAINVLVIPSQVGNTKKFLGTNGTSLIFDDSEGLGYTQGGTGSVKVDLADRLRVASTPEDFGAVGDGVVDDGPALQLWLNDLALVGGGAFLPSKVYLSKQELILRGAKHVMFMGPGIVKADDALYASTSFIHKLLELIDCENIIFAGQAFEGVGSTKPTKDNARRLIVIGANTKTESILFSYCKFRFSASQAVIIESVERGVGTDDPITAPSAVITSDVKFDHCRSEDGHGLAITFNGGCQNFSVSNTGFFNSEGTQIKLDAEIRVGGSSVNPNSAPAMFGASLTDLYFENVIQEVGTSGGFITIEERVSATTMSNHTFNACSTDSVNTPFYRIGPGQGEFPVNGVTMNGVRIFGGSMHVFLRVAGGGVNGTGDVENIFFNDVVTRGVTMVATPNFVSLENNEVKDISLSNFDIDTQIGRFILAAPFAGGDIKMKGIKADCVNNFASTIGSCDIELIDCPDITYGLQFIDADPWAGEAIIERNTLRGPGGGTVADIFLNNTATTSDAVIRNNTWLGGFVAGQSRINVTGTPITTRNAAIIENNHLGSVHDGIRCVFNGVAKGNVVSAFAVGAGRFINFAAGAAGRGGGNIMAASANKPSTPTSGYTTDAEV